MTPDGTRDRYGQDCWRGKGERRSEGAGHSSDEIPDHYHVEPERTRRRLADGDRAVEFFIAQHRALDDEVFPNDRDGCESTEREGRCSEHQEYKQPRSLFHLEEHCTEATGDEQDYERRDWETASSRGWRGSSDPATAMLLKLGAQQSDNRPGEDGQRSGTGSLHSLARERMIGNST